uniref:Uncharacterized protein n=1 Tax=viral metagenome TaxID=1070528 RepID=A0A6M3K8F5_9ZZZZ
MPDPQERKYPQPSIWEYLQWVRQEYGWKEMRNALVGSRNPTEYPKYQKLYTEWYEQVWTPANAVAFQPYEVSGKPTAPGQSPEEQAFAQQVSGESTQARSEYMEIVWEHLQDQVARGLMTEAMATEGYRQQYYELFPETAPDVAVPGLYAGMGLQTTTTDIFNQLNIGQTRKVLTPRPIKNTKYYADVQSWLKRKQQETFDAGDLTSAQAIANMRTAVTRNLKSGEALTPGGEFAPPRVGVAPEAQILGVESVTPEYYQKMQAQQARDEALYRSVTKPTEAATLPMLNEDTAGVYTDALPSLRLSPAQQRMFTYQNLMSDFQAKNQPEVQAWFTALANMPMPIDEQVQRAQQELAQLQSSAAGITERYWGTPEEQELGMLSRGKPSQMENVILRGAEAIEKNVLPELFRQQEQVRAGTLTEPKEPAKPQTFEDYMAKYPYRDIWLKTPPTWRGARMSQSRSRWFT